MNIHQPHDKLFKKTFGLKGLIIDFLKIHLSPEVLQKLDFSTLELQKDSFLDNKFNAYYSDVIHKVHSVDGEGYLYFLLEHQSTSDPLIVGKLLCYIGNIVYYDIKRQLNSRGNRGKVKRPVIYPFVIYSGKEKYKWPKQLTIDIDGVNFFNLDNSLIELRDYSLEELLKSKKAALAQFILKESWKKDFCKVLKANPQLDELINNSPYAIDAMLYMIDQDPHGKEVVKALQNLNPKIKQNVMGNLLRIEQKGRTEGMQIGEQKGRTEGMQIGEQKGRTEGFREAIMRLLDRGVNKTETAKLLGLTLEKLDYLLAH